MLRKPSVSALQLSSRVRLYIVFMPEPSIEVWGAKLGSLCCESVDVVSLKWAGRF